MISFTDRNKHVSFTGNIKGDASYEKLELCNETKQKLSILNEATELPHESIIGISDKAKEEVAKLDDTTAFFVEINSIRKELYDLGKTMNKLMNEMKADMKYKLVH